MTIAVILSAGESSRMESNPKANLLFNDKTFLSIIADIFYKAGLGKIYVVVGKDAELIKKANKDLDVEFLTNKEYKKGQLSSIKVSLEHIPKTCDSIMIHLVDHPLIQKKTVKTILTARKSTNAPVIIPVFKGKRGHPVLFGSEVFDDLKSAPMDVGARSVVWKYAKNVHEIATDDQGILLNINTPELYQKWCQA